MTRTDWRVNIERLMKSVTENQGAEVAQAVFIRVGATCFDDRSPCFYEEVFGNLMLIDSED